MVSEEIYDADEEINIDVEELSSSSSSDEWEVYYNDNIASVVLPEEAQVSEFSLEHQIHFVDLDMISSSTTAPSSIESESFDIPKVFKIVLKNKLIKNI